MYPAPLLFCGYPRASATLRPSAPGARGVAVERRGARKSAARTPQGARARAGTNLVVMMTVAVAVTVLVVMTMSMVLGLVARLILCRSHEVHRTLTGVVFVAVLVPVLGMSWRNVQVD